MKKFFFITFYSCFLLSCATIQYPSGGPRDVSPPKLLEAQPGNGTVNFQAKKIVLIFDEGIDITSAEKEVYITPQLSSPPSFRVRKNKLSVLLPSEALRPNTTYSINFGKAIVDVTERNSAKDVIYVFSTGPQIDSLIVSGSIVSPFDANSQSDILVGLYSVGADMTTEAPLWFVYADTSGAFKLEHLKAGSYNIYAFATNPGNNLFVYSNAVACYPKTLQLNENIEGLALTLFKQRAPELKILESSFDGEVLVIKLNSEFYPADLSYQVEMPKGLKSYLLNDEGITDTLRFALSELNFELLKMRLEDSYSGSSDILSVRRPVTVNELRGIKISTNVRNRVLSAPQLEIAFPAPVKRIESSQIQLYYENERVYDFSLQKGRCLEDGSCLTYILSCNWVNDKGLYKLVVPKQSFETAHGAQNFDIQEEFAVKNQPKYFGVIKFTLSYSGTDPILARLYKGHEVIREQKWDPNGALIFERLAPASYQLFFIRDDNNNGRFDAGDCMKAIPPEPVIRYPAEISVKSNWEYEEAFELKF